MLPKFPVHAPIGNIPMSRSWVIYLVDLVEARLVHVVNYKMVALQRTPLKQVNRRKCSRQVCSRLNYVRSVTPNVILLYVVRAPIPHTRKTNNQPYKIYISFQCTRLTELSRT
jgi:hypothetical protein